MARKATKAADNIYYKARMEAAATNDKLNSREGAAEIIGIDRTRLARIELDSICAYPEEVLMMSDAYNAPELNNYFCCEQCPIGKHTVPHLELTDIGYLAIQISVSLKNPEFMIDRLMEIVQDGIISKNEKPELKSIVGKLDGFSEKVQSLKLWAQKNLK
ncbi:MAG: XRE family transcriptional regulator [Clostridium sp.]|jgi:hypothetical protein|uniref:XRE family transcriptional regulator n=1 Tax=Clostridium sp. TaxID=1506 RepID=UPI0025C48B8E|nr:XRE family transcriptional regulator [Clostridium sp.]MCH3962948.1 XRE family transcriptional regulator [Clostridium sp.]MCI1800157.1 XRE family transcriptional regulator [Clostridium sp.]MCI2200152.1 XRE family transcriptional regulator [Clostridium sp.]